MKMKRKQVKSSAQVKAVQLCQHCQRALDNSDMAKVDPVQEKIEEEVVLSSKHLKKATNQVVKEVMKVIDPLLIKLKEAADQQKHEQENAEQVHEAQVVPIVEPNLEGIEKITQNRLQMIANQEQKINNRIQKLQSRMMKKNPGMGIKKK
mgnify:CR=1 FL=1